jgi:hypothetical protein
LKTAAKVAVASSVHGRIQRRQQQRWAAQDQANGTTAPSPPPPQHAIPAQSAEINDRLAQLKRVGELLLAGVLTRPSSSSKRNRS